MNSSTVREFFYYGDHENEPRATKKRTNSVRLKTQKPKLAPDYQYINLGLVGKRRLERPTPTSRT